MGRKRSRLFYGRMACGLGADKVEFGILQQQSAFRGDNFYLVGKAVTLSQFFGNYKSSKSVDFFHNSDFAHIVSSDRFYMCYILHKTFYILLFYYNSFIIKMSILNLAR